MAARSRPALIRDIVELRPGRLARRRPAFATPAPARAAYVQHLTRRLQAPRAFLEEAHACPLTCSYDYAVIRVVPRVERQEFVNAGVICRASEHDFLEARDRAR